MVSKWQKSIDTEELAKINALFENQSIFHIHQHPLWAKAEFGERINYHLTYDEEVLVGYVALNESTKRRIVYADFGPVCEDMETLVFVLKDISAKYKKRGFGSFRILLPWIVSNESFGRLYRLKKQFHFTIEVDINNKSTSYVDLVNLETSKKGFRKNHLRNIKKAEKLGIIARKLNSIEEVNAFSEGIYDMFSYKGILKNLEQEKTMYQSFFNILCENQLGFFLGIFDTEENMIGGNLITYHKEKAFYYAGFAHPNFRKLPVTQVGFYQAMKTAKKEGRNTFDMGGYNPMVDENSSVYNINHFKDGFSKEYVYYLPILSINLNRWVQNSVKTVEKLIGFSAKK